MVDQTCPGDGSLDQASLDMLAWIQARIILKNYDAKLWTDESNVAAMAFLTNPGIKRLVAWVDSNKGVLHLSTTDMPRPTAAVLEVAFFVRPKGTAITPSSIESVVQFGTFSTTQTAASVMYKMEKIFHPQIFNSVDWPEATRRELTGHYHRLMASLTESANHAEGKTTLYLPSTKQYSLDECTEASNKEAVQQIESLAIHWTRQIKGVLNSHYDTTDAELSGPMEEVHFWKMRSADLSNISVQLCSDEVGHFMSILEATKSSYLAQLSELFTELQESSREAENNFKFLEILAEPCQKLAEAKSTEIPEVLPSVLNRVRIISTLSQFYNTEDRLTRLLRKISHEIICRCQEEISVDEIIDGNVELSIACLHNATKCGLEWKRIYRRTAAAVNKARSRKETKASAIEWDFDETSIFAQIDAFMQRCQDLLDVCEGQIQFARKSSSTARGGSGPLPDFKGTRGSEIAKALLDIDSSFKRLLKTQLQCLEYDILDVRSLSWHDDFNKFKAGVKDLDVMYTNVINLSFAPIRGLEPAIELLETFSMLARRNAVHRCLEKRAHDVRLLFIRHCQDIRQEFEENRLDPPRSITQPKYAGSALWARCLKSCVDEGYTRLTNSRCSSLRTSNEAVETAYGSLVAALQSFQTKCFQSWLEHMSSIDEEDFHSRLTQPLLGLLGETAIETTKKLPVRPLICNFDPELITLFAEVQHWGKFHTEEFEVPTIVLSICHRHEELRLLRERVMLIVRACNELLSDLTEERYHLFLDHLRLVERKLKTGFFRLNWSSKPMDVDRFVQACTTEINSVHTVVKEFNDAWSSILNQCHTMSSLLLIDLDKNFLYKHGTFEAQQCKHRTECKLQLERSHQSIREAIEKVSINFKHGSTEVKGEFESLMVSVDNMVEDSLRTNVKKSLQALSRVMHSRSELSHSPQNLFQVRAVLDNDRIECSPTMIDVTHAVNSVTKELVGTITVVPRLLNIPDGENEIESSSTLKGQAMQPSFYDIISSNDDVLNLVVQIMNRMTSSAASVRKELAGWDEHKPLWDMDKGSFIRRYAKANRSLESYDQDISKYKAQQVGIEEKNDTISINFIKVDFASLKASLVCHTVEWQERLSELLHRNAKSELSHLHKLMDSMHDKLSHPPLDIPALSNMIECAEKLTCEKYAIEAKFNPLETMYHLLEKFQIPKTDDEEQKLDDLHPRWERLQDVKQDAEVTIEKSQVSMKRDLDSSVAKYHERAKALRDEFVTGLSTITPDLSIAQASSRIAHYEKKVDSLKNVELALQPGLVLFEMELSDSKDLHDCQRELELMTQIWGQKEDWDKQWKSWQHSMLADLDPEIMEGITGNFNKNVAKLRREIDSWGVCVSLRDSIEKLKCFLPLIQDLRSDALRDRHWDSLRREIGRNFDSSPHVLTLGDVITLGFHNHADFIADISARAKKELAIEKSLDEIELRWSSVKIDIVAHKGSFHKIKSAEDLYEMLEDDTVALSTIKASKYYVPFQRLVDSLERTLSHVYEVLDVWLTVQKKWIYLESIFIGGGDTSKQLPQAHNLFLSVHEDFVGFMRAANENPNAMHVCCENPGVLTMLAGMVKSLDRIQKALDSYLDKKRMAFPRFYFVSDDDLLEILGKAKDPMQVEKHVKKVFEGIDSLVFTDSGRENGKPVVSGGKSLDGETLNFTDGVTLDGPVETWFVHILESMKLGLQRALGGCLQAAKGNKNDGWVREWQGQLLITTGAIAWNVSCTKALHSISSGKDKNAMRAVRKRQVAFLRRLTNLIRDSDLGEVDRSKAVALITMEIHNRDVVERLVKSGCSDAQDFLWLSQLRFVYDTSKEDGPYGRCSVRQTNCLLPYSYEYQGNNGRLVITPLTDRCVLTLLTAMHLHRGGNPLGPAGTGKTETVKDLAKQLAKYCIVSNCSDGMDYKSVGRIFSGLCQSGVWGCFDEFNRIKIDVISVVAMQILSIFNAQRAHQSHFSFMGTTIPCSREAGIFITMNPGYAGRTELPDNLKALMRPVAMMSPDLNLIAEVMLAAEGFSGARSLAKKTITLYTLMQQQLSKQDHYDYGLRNLKSVLNMAGTLKRADADASEDIILMRALRDMNVPKFITDDLKLFVCLLGDLFPGVDVATCAPDALLSSIERELGRQGLERHAFLIDKILQLNDSQLTRHCNMLVGKTMSGKSTAWKTLAAAKTSMAKDDKIEDAKVVNTYVINPKSITMTELYGAYDLQTCTWADGILSKTFKQCSESNKPDDKWIVFDGPIDAMWIESMNSVMDDNKVLTLINGDRIPLSTSMSLVFEVEDLSVASPATVSRAGMIYIDEAEMGWQHYVTSWLKKKFGASSDQYSFHEKLFEKYVEKILLYKSKNCREPVPIADFNAVKSLIALYSALATPENGVVHDEGQGPSQSYYSRVENWFVFSIVWSLMAAVDEQGRIALDRYFRELAPLFPPVQTVYDYYIDPRKQKFAPWSSKLPNWKPTAGSSFHKLIVPTVDTLRNNFVLSTLVNAGRPVLVGGTTGAGKTTIAQAVLGQLPQTHSYLTINFSSATSSRETQSTIEGAMEKRSKDKIGPSGGKTLVIFVDDMNMPRKESAESPFQPPLELLRQYLDYGGWYDREKCTWRAVMDSQLVSAMAPPSGGRETICNRFQARFCLLNCTYPSDSQIVHIFQSILSTKLNSFEREIKSMCIPLAKATLDVYKQVKEKFFPTPVKSHYLFNSRDMAAVIQGVLQAEDRYVHTKEHMLRLWVHESMRIYSDRFIRDESNDTSRFVELLGHVLQEQFGIDWATLMKHSITEDRGPIFVSFINENPSDTRLRYEEASGFVSLRSKLSESLQGYNNEPKNLPLNLVLFEDAIKNVCRIHRVLQQDRGNMMLVGVGGSGRQSLTRLASYVAKIDVFTVEVTKHYRSVEFREDLKTIYMRCGVEAQQMVFFLKDTQIKDETFLEDVNNILASGEIPSLFTKEDKIGIIDSIRKAAKVAGLDDETPDAIWQFFVDRVRSNLHVILAMSPVGDALRERCRAFPALVNCTNINWFGMWPREALQEVAAQFLTSVKLDSDEQRSDVAHTISSIHMDVIHASAQMEKELKRSNYVTPTDYLELVNGFVSLIGEKRTELGEQKTKLSNGLSKLEESRIQVEKMSSELEKTKFAVDDQQVKCEEMLKVIVAERRAAEDQKRTVESESETIGKEERECQAIASDAEADLAIALPALEKALQEVDKLDKGAIAEIKAYSNPPPAVEKVMSCVMTLLGRSTDWASAKKALGETSFLSNLKTYDKDAIKASLISKVKKYVSNATFAPEEVNKVSTAAGALCAWCHAIYVYAEVSKYVAPKRAKLKSAQDGLALKQAALANARANLDVIVAKVVELKKRYQCSVDEKNRLRQEAEDLEDKLGRAEKLIDGLGGEYERWKASIIVFEESIANLVGDSLVASGFLSYAGCFGVEYRKKLVARWADSVRSRKLPMSKDFSFALFLSKPTDVRDWNIQGLPQDGFSTENGVIVQRCRRWPLAIDPQGQANKWVRAKEGNSLKIIDLKMKDFMREVETAITYGVPVLLQDIMEELDPILEPVLSKSIRKVGNRHVIRLGDKEIDFSDEFRMYITTRMSNPHFTPEISTKTTIVNFSVTELGLEDQLLGVVVNQEEPDLEHQKGQLTVEIASGKSKLVDLEDDILRLLAESTGSLLDDVELIDTLQASKVTASQVTQQVLVAEETERKIDASREEYRPAATRSTIAFFVLKDLASVDPMYQFSLDSFIILFKKSIKGSRTKGSNEEKDRNEVDRSNLVVSSRVDEINQYHTQSVYKTTCVGLFERHKLLFSLQLCINIMKKEGKVPQQEFEYICYGGVTVDRENQGAPPCTPWIHAKMWDDLTELEAIPVFGGLLKELEDNPKAWKQWYMSSMPEDATLPNGWNERLNDLQKMCLLRAFRPDRLLFAASVFVSNNLGSAYVDPPSFDLTNIYASSSPEMPLIFILSPGVDPTVQIEQLANSMNCEVNQVALGQGQAPTAVKAIKHGVQSGSWVLLANCHLMLSWMPELEKMVDSYCEKDQLHKNYRLWLSSNPNPGFPMSLLQRGVKITTEPPRGLDRFGECRQREKYKKLLFALSWFHATLLERRKFKSLGFNTPYEFNQSDFLICHDLIVVFLNEYPDDKTPFDAMQYLIGEANYGGRVTDDWDRRLVRVLMRQYFCEGAVEVDKFALCSELANDYHIPPGGDDLAHYKAFVRSLPHTDHPAAFGQHSNADISSHIEDANNLLSTMVSLQPNTVADGEETREQRVGRQVIALLNKVPEPFVIDAVKDAVALRSDPDAFKTVLLQEVERYNVLLSLISLSLREVDQATRGRMVLTPELEETMTALSEYRVPKSWSVAYPSSKPLGSWMLDLATRVDQLRSWINRSPREPKPSVFWLSGFTYPTAFLTAVMQTSARQRGVAIDELSWEFHVLKEQNPEDISTGPEEGIYVHGMYLEGAKWDMDHGCLTEPLPMELTSQMPIVHFQPVDGWRKKSLKRGDVGKGTYTCPLYMYPVRMGSRERPSFVVSVELSIGEPSDEDHWTKRGTAMLLSISD